MYFTEERTTHRSVLIRQIWKSHSRIEAFTMTLVHTLSFNKFCEGVETFCSADICYYGVSIHLLPSKPEGVQGNHGDCGTGSCILCTRGSINATHL